MSHGMEVGDLMFSVREPVWHLNENRDKVSMLAEYPGREEGMFLSGQAFRVEERVVLQAPEGYAFDGEGTLHGPFDAVPVGLMGSPILGWKALVRSDNGAVLHVAKSSYTVVQPEVLWDLQEALQDVDPVGVQYVTAGTLKGGAIMWVLSRLNEPHQVTGTDTLVYPYLLTSTTHDGSGALRADLSEIVVVCQNTYRMATEAGAPSYTFRHTRNVQERIEDAKGALFGARSSHQAFIELTEELAGLRVTGEGVGMFLKAFLPDPPAYLASDRVLANVEEARAKVRAVLEGGITVPEYHRNTAYGLFSAGTEYLDHLRPARNPDTMFGRSLLRQERVKDKLVPLVRRIARDYALS